MKTQATYQESPSKQGFGARLMFYLLLLMMLGASKMFAQVPIAPTATTVDNFTCTSANVNWGAVSGGIAYFLDVSTDASFASFISGYTNLNVGNMTHYITTNLTPNTIYYYRVRVSDGNSTSANSNTISFNSCGTLSPIEYISATFCQSGNNPYPTINITGGTFSSTPAGLVLDSNTGEINLAGSTIGAYTLTYTYNSNSYSIIMTITSTTPDATFSYGAYLFDPGATNPLPVFGAGASAGSFLGDVGLVINANTGEVDLAASTAGRHYITNTIPQSGSCAPAQDDDTIFIAPVAGCSAFIFSNAPVWQTANCLTDTVNLSTVYDYFGLSAGTSLVFVNWGDGTVDDTFAITHAAGDGLLFLDGAVHLYSSPGVYTILSTIIDPSACNNDTIFELIDIGNNCSNLVGTIYVDANSNCSLDNGEVGVPYVQLSATLGGNTYYAWSDFNGNYAFPNLPLGTYNVQVDAIGSGYSITCNNSLPHSESISSGTITANFATTCSGALDVAVTGISLMSGFYPGGNDAILPHIGVLNGTCSTTPMAGQVKVILDACIQYTTSGWSMGNAPDAVITASTGDTLVWNVSDINNIGNFGYFNYPANVSTCTSAQVGDTACITVMILPTGGDADPSNNTFTRCFAIGVAYDPNSKEVSPKGEGSQGFIPVETPSLTYTINFQNTGTALAHNIYVLDTIDAALDANNIEILSASHRMKVYSLPNRVIKFMFADILLPDSTSDELHSHGYVTFKMKPNTGLAAGTQIKNTGYIYFDYNEPVVTNTALNTINLNTGIASSIDPVEFNVYPNPAKEKVMVVIPKNQTGAIVIMDLLGKVIKEQKATEALTEVSLSELSEGVYFIKVTQGNNCSTKKIVVSK